MAAPSPSSASPAIPARVKVSAPSRRASSMCRSATRRRWKRRSRPNTVAFLVEPIQGEAGVIIPPAGYLKTARESFAPGTMCCSSWTRSRPGSAAPARLLAEEHDGIEADLTLIGKALSGGFYPVSAVLSNSEAMSVLHPGEHGSTFGGNPLACAVARMALKVLVEEGMIENAARSGRRLMAQLAGHSCARHGAGGARPRPDARRRTVSRCGRRAPCLRRSSSGRGLLAKETHRPYHPHRAAADPDGRPGRLDRGTVQGAS